MWGPNVKSTTAFVNLVVKKTPETASPPMTVKDLGAYRPRGDATGLEREARRANDGVYYTTRDLAVRVTDASKLPVVPLPPTNR